MKCKFARSKRRRRRRRRAVIGLELISGHEYPWQFQPDSSQTVKYNNLRSSSDLFGILMNHNQFLLT
jgi:hypothetical protein